MHESDEQKRPSTASTKARAPKPQNKAKTTSLLSFRPIFLSVVFVAIIAFLHQQAQPVQNGSSALPNFEGTLALSGVSIQTHTTGKMETFYKQVFQLVETDRGEMPSPLPRYITKPLAFLRGSPVYRFLEWTVVKVRGMLRKNPTVFLSGNPYTHHEVSLTQLAAMPPITARASTSSGLPNTRTNFFEIGWRAKNVSVLCDMAKRVTQLGAKADTFFDGSCWSLSFTDPDGNPQKVCVPSRHVLSYPHTLYLPFDCDQSWSMSKLEDEATRAIANLPSQASMKRKSWLSHRQKSKRLSFDEELEHWQRDVFFESAALRVRNLTGMAEFYENVLALPNSGAAMFHEHRAVVFATHTSSKFNLALVHDPENVPHPSSLSASSYLHNTALNKLSFRVDSLDDLKEMYARLHNSRAHSIVSVSRGSSWAIEFYDEEDNFVEVYVDAPWHVQQPFLAPLDLTASFQDICQHTLRQAFYGNSTNRTSTEPHPQFQGWVNRVNSLGNQMLATPEDEDEVRIVHMACQHRGETALNLCPLLPHACYGTYMQFMDTIDARTANSKEDVPVPVSSAVGLTYLRERNKAKKQQQQR